MSDNGRLRQGAGGYARGTRRRRGLVLPMLYELIRPLLSVDGRMDLDAMKFMQDTLLELGVIKTRLPFTDMYTAEFTPVKL